MSKSDKPKDTKGKEGGKKHEKALEALQIGLSSMQRALIDRQARVLVILEGRDAAGKDGTIKRIVEHMSPRDTRVVALPTPNDHDRRAWYFQRWCAHLPIAGEFVLFNRSWYNRAGVERVMGFCSEAEVAEFFATVPLFEQLLTHSGIHVLKYYLDIGKDEQKRRIKERKTDPLKQWKISPIDEVAVKKWDDYTQARNEMLARTHSVFAPWTVVRADDKPHARLALIRDLLGRCGEILGEDARQWLGKGAQTIERAGLPDPSCAFLYDPLALSKGWLAE
ncbi:MAG TPA: polyphosphate kinase 2 [Novosphingobium sp.]|nr:polyphosphate kinase 2 [Novosphingobium sp.]